MTSGWADFPPAGPGPPARLHVPSEALVFGRSVVAGPAAKPLGVEVAEVLGRGKAHRVGHLRHRAEVAGLQPLPGQGHGLAPAYDLVATALMNPADTEELMLTLNGKKEKLRPEDFLAAAQRAGVDEKVMTGVFTRLVRVRPAWEKLLAESFLTPELKEGYLALLHRKFKQLGLT